jgi:CRP/FNR family transcriptional regulator, cyclic AMP receptor protein
MILTVTMSRTSATLTFTVPDEVQNELEALASTQREQPNAVLFRQGEPARGVYLIRRGSVVLSFEDRRQRRAGQGWILGLPSTFSGEPYSLTAITAESCEFAFIPREKVIKFVRLNPALAMHLLEILANEVSAVRGMANGNRTVH